MITYAPGNGPVFRSPEMLHQVEQLVGEPFFQNQDVEQQAMDVNSREARRIAEENPARAQLFGMAVRHIVQAQRKNEQIDTKQLDMIGRKLRLINNLDAYLDSDDIYAHTDGYEHQLPVFNSLRKAIVNYDPEEGLRGYIEMPMSTGKSAVIVYLAQAIAGLDPEKRLKTLVLTPSDIVRTQNAGKDGKGFALLDSDSDLKISSKDAKGKYPLDGDVDVVNYQALLRSGKTFDAIKEKDYDLIICDEGHRALGPRTQEALDEIAPGKVVINTTATADYAENYGVEDYFEVRIHKMSFREAGEMGAIQPIQLRIHDTKARVDFNSRTSTYTEEDYEQLANIKARNADGASETAKLVAEGKQGIVSCLPGANRFHAKHMAKLINQELITLPDGKKRYVKAASVDGSMSKQDVEDALEQYDRGELDALCYVDLLGEGWDQPRARFLINMRPTDSPVLAKQRIGRVMRKNGTDEPNIVVDFIDRTRKVQYTAIEAFNFSDEEINRMYNSSKYSAGLDRDPDLTAPAWMNVSFDDMESQKLYEEVIRAMIRRAPEDSISYRQAALVLNKSVSDIYRITKELEMDVDRYRGDSGHIGYHLTPEQFGEIVSSMDASDMASEDDATMAELAEESGMPIGELRQLVKDNGISPTYQRGFGHVIYDRETVKSTVKHFMEAGTDIADHESMNGSELDDVPLINLRVLYPFISAPVLMKAIQDMRIKLKSETVQNKQLLAVSPRDAKRLEDNLMDFFETPEGAEDVEWLCEESGLSQRVIADGMGYLQDSGLFTLDTYKIGKKSKTIVTIDPEKRDELIERLSEFASPPFGSLHLNDVPRQYADNLEDNARARFTNKYMDRSQLRQYRAGKKGKKVFYLTEQGRYYLTKTFRTESEEVNRNIGDYVSLRAFRSIASSKDIDAALSTASFSVPTSFRSAIHNSQTKVVEVVAREYVAEFGIKLQDYRKRHGELSLRQMRARERAEIIKRGSQSS